MLQQFKEDLLEHLKIKFEGQKVAAKIVRQEIKSFTEEYFSKKNIAVKVRLKRSSITIKVKQKSPKTIMKIKEKI